MHNNHNKGTAPRAPTDLTNQLWQYLEKHCQGRDNAKKQPEIAAIMGISVREVRHLTEILTVEQERPVASTIHPPYGIYIPVLKEEREEYISQLKARIMAMFKRLKAFSNATASDIIKQMRLQL